MDEIAFIARQSEGSWTPEWVMKQPIFYRKKLVKQLQKEIKDRQAQSNTKKS